MQQPELKTLLQKIIQAEQTRDWPHCTLLCEQALKLINAEQNWPLWATLCCMLGNSLAKDPQGVRAENLEQAIAHHEQALTVFTLEAFPKEWAMTQNNLANAYRDRIRGERAKNLEQAIAHFEQALTVRTRAAFPEDWAGTQNNLGMAYGTRIRGERAENLEQAIAHYKQALTVRTRKAFPADWAMTQNNLGMAYGTRIRGGRAENLEQAIAHYEQALTVRTIDRFPADHPQTQRNLGNLYFEAGTWNLAHEAYAAAIETGKTLLGEAYTEFGRRTEVGATSRLYARDAYSLWRLQKPAEGFLRLEQGKTRLLVEALALNNADLATLPTPHKAAMHTARETVRSLDTEQRLSPGTPARRHDRELAESLREARANLAHLIETIRAERPEFMPMGLDLLKLMALIPNDGALVAPLITSQGSVVFVLTSGTTTLTEKQVIPVDQFTDATLRTLLQGPPESADLGGWLGAYRNFLYASDATRRLHEQAWHETIEGMGKELWNGLLGRVHSHLTALKLPEGAPVVLMPQGGLGLLPFHAAWREVNGVKRAFLDDYTVSYAPSGYALRTSHQRLQESQRQPHRLLAVINPTADLDFTPMEGHAVGRLFDPDARQELVESAATPDAVIKGVPGQSHVHFSCHGFYSWDDPMQSGLLLADRVPLTLADTIGHLDLSASQLVTLSACETGLTDIRQSPDEYLGLPTGFLQAGAPSVVSTLWAVNDLSTMLLMERFYHHHLQDKLSPSPALRQAQRWLRDDATAGELHTRFTKERDALLAAGEPTGLVEDQVDRFASMDPFSCPFASPFYWAAFTVNGA